MELPPALKRALSDEGRDILGMGLDVSPARDDDAGVDEVDSNDDIGEVTGIANPLAGSYASAAPATLDEEDDQDPWGSEDSFDYGEVVAYTAAAAPVSTATTVAGGFAVGEEVVVTSRGRTYCATITAIGVSRWGSATFDVVDPISGAMESGVGKYCVKARFTPAVGDAVEVKKTPRAWKWSYGAVVDADVASDAFTIDLDDGTTLTNVSSALMRAAKVVPRVELDAVEQWPDTLRTLRAAGGPPTPPPPAHQIIVPKRWGGGTTMEECDPSTLVPSLSGALQPGQRCAALWTPMQQGLFLATIERVAEDGDFVDLLYDDGDRKESIPRSWLAQPSASAEYEGEVAPDVLPVPGQSVLIELDPWYKSDPSWQIGLYKGVEETATVEFAPDEELAALISVWKGDITHLAVDGIQNAANSGLWAGGGICGAIHSAAGPMLADACDALPIVECTQSVRPDGVGPPGGGGGAAAAVEEDSSSDDGGGGGIFGIFNTGKSGGGGGGYTSKYASWGDRCDAGDTKVTEGYRLHANFVLHTVGPMGIKPDTLRSAYRSALDAAVTHEMRSVAFCCISTGIYGYPSKHATPVALSAVREWLQEDGNRTKLDRIIFCVFETKDLQLCVTVFAL